MGKGDVTFTGNLSSDFSTGDTHRVKSWCYLYEQAVVGKKTHDFRDMRDRDYKVGDTLILCEFDQTTGKYTGNECAFEITYMTNRDTPCAMSSVALEQNHVVLSKEKTMRTQGEQITVHSLGDGKEYRGEINGLMYDDGVSIIYIVKMIDKIASSEWSHATIPECCIK